MVGGQSSVTLHRLCELKYAGAQGTVLQHLLRHDTTSRVDSTAQKTKIAIFHSFPGAGEAQGRLWVGLDQHSGDRGS